MKTPPTSSQNRQSGKIRIEISPRRPARQTYSPAICEESTCATSAVEKVSLIAVFPEAPRGVAKNSLFVEALDQPGQEAR